MRPTNFLNLVLTFLVLLMNLCVLLAPVISHERWVIISILTLDVVLLRITNVHWHLIHEAAHRILFSQSRLNEHAGYWLSVFFFSSFNALRFGHLLHHRTNRHEDLTEVYFGKRPPRLRYYAEILGGFFLIAEF